MIRKPTRTYKHDAEPIFFMRTNTHIYGTMFRKVATEGRESIRESLRIFHNVQTFITASPNQEGFQQLFKRVINNPSLEQLNNRSCGNTMMMLASLFVSKEQSSMAQLDNIINGNPFYCLASNPNILVHSFRAQHFMQSFKESSKSVQVFRPEEKNYRLLKGISKFTAGVGFNNLRSCLLDSDEDINLPRVFFCSIAWISPLAWMNPNENIDTLSIKDHKFTVIKHTNDRYQIVQGYIPNDNDRRWRSFKVDECNKMHASSPFTGYDQRSWLLSGHAYSAQQGFSKTSMVSFLSHLGAFTTGKQFDSHSYAQMFGVHVDAIRCSGRFTGTAGHTKEESSNNSSSSCSRSKMIDEVHNHENSNATTTTTASAPYKSISSSSNGCSSYGNICCATRSDYNSSDEVVNCCYDHLPSLSFRELDDNDIIGYGTRDFARAIEKAIRY